MKNEFVRYCNLDAAEAASFFALFNLHISISFITFSVFCSGK